MTKTFLPRRPALAVAGLVTLGAPGLAAATDAQLKIELPRLKVAEYHKPYVAVWLERPGVSTAVATLAVWYDQNKPNNGGAKWLHDLRQWWRAGGKSLALPADGISGATRGPGEHTVDMGRSPALAALPPGAYEVVVEAAREDGGREVRRLPLTLPLAPGATAQVQGDDELGALRLATKP